MTLKNNSAPLLCCFQLCAWFHCHMLIQTGVRVRKGLSWVLTSVTLTFDLWPWPFAWTSLLAMVITPENFMMIRWWEHGEKGVTDGQTDRQMDGLNQSYSCLVAAKNNRAPLLYLFKLYASFHSHWWVYFWVTVRKRSNWVKFYYFLPPVTLKLYGWPWKTIGHLYYATSSSMHHFKAMGEFKLESQSGNAQFGSKLMIFFSCVTLQFHVWPWKTIGHLFYATSSFVHHCVAIGEFKLELQSGNAQSGSNSAIFRAVWPWNLTNDLEKQ